MHPTIYHNHKNHKIEIIDQPIQIGTTLSHPGKIMCTTCNKFIKWIGKREIDFIHNNNIKDLDNLTFGEFTSIYNVMTNTPEIEKPKKLYLKVDYSEKDKVRQLGAKWDKVVKKWYINSDSPKTKQLEQWMSISQIANNKTK